MKSDFKLVDWMDRRVAEVEEQIKNTRTWVYESENDYEDRIIAFVSGRFFSRAWWKCMN